MGILGDPGAASWGDGIFTGGKLSGQSASGISNASGTRSVRVNSRGLSRPCCKLSPVKIPSPQLAAPGSPRMDHEQIMTGEYRLADTWSQDDSGNLRMKSIYRRNTNLLR